MFDVVYEINKFFAQVKAEGDTFNYIQKPKINNKIQFYIGWGKDDIFGDFFVDFENNTVNFTHSNDVVTFSFETFKKDMAKILKAYIDGFDEFEEIL